MSCRRGPASRSVRRTGSGPHPRPFLIQGRISRKTGPASVEDLWRRVRVPIASLTRIVEAN